MNREEALAQNPAFPCPREILDRQVFVEVDFYDFDGDVADLQFEWDDDRSMAANNTSGFNYRPMTGDGTSATRLSPHALGRAIDINPLLNPYIKGEMIKPDGAVYDPSRPGTITADSFIVKFLKKRGWTWGGDWTSLKDYQHFEKI
jgi:hypothetical protein